MKPETEYASEAISHEMLPTPENDKLKTKANEALAYVYAHLAPSSFVETVSKLLAANERRIRAGKL